MLTIFLSHHLVTTADSQTLLSWSPNIYSTSVHPLSPSLHHSCYLHSLILPPLPLYSFHCSLLPSSPLPLYLHHQPICACLALCWHLWHHQSRKMRKFWDKRKKGTLKDLRQNKCGMEKYSDFTSMPRCFHHHRQEEWAVIWCLNSWGGREGNGNGERWKMKKTVFCSALRRTHSVLGFKRIDEGSRTRQWACSDRVITCILSNPNTSGQH